MSGSASKILSWAAVVSAGVCVFVHVMPTPKYEPAEYSTWRSTTGKHVNYPFGSEYYMLIDGYDAKKRKISFGTEYGIVRSKRFYRDGCNLKYIAKIRIPDDARIEYSIDGDWTTTNRGEIYDTEKIYESPLLDDILLHNPEFAKCLPNRNSMIKKY